MNHQEQTSDDPKYPHLGGGQKTINQDNEKDERGESTEGGETAEGIDVSRMLEMDLALFVDYEEHPGVLRHIVENHEKLSEINFCLLLFMNESSCRNTKKRLEGMENVIVVTTITDTLQAVQTALIMELMKFNIALLAHKNTLAEFCIISSRAYAAEACMRLKYDNMANISNMTSRRNCCVVDPIGVNVSDVLIRKFARPASSSDDDDEDDDQYQQSSLVSIPETKQLIPRSHSNGRTPPRHASGKTSPQGPNVNISHQIAQLAESFETQGLWSRSSISPRGENGEILHEGGPLSGRMHAQLSTMRKWLATQPEQYVTFSVLGQHFALSNEEKLKYGKTWPKVFDRHPEFLELLNAESTTCAGGQCLKKI
jgi:hypothetical protein